MTILILLSWVEQSQSQPDVTTVNLKVQHVKGCVNLIYPSETGDVITDQDSHELQAPTGGGTLGITGRLERDVTRSLSESRDGVTHTKEELAAAEYQEVPRAGKRYMVKAFTVARRVTFKLCVKPGFDGDHVTLEARQFDYQLQQNTEPDNLLQFATAATTERVRQANHAFTERAKTAIDRLLAGINQRTLPLEDVEIVQMLRRTGIEKRVTFRFAGGDHSTTVKLRRIRD